MKDNDVQTVETQAQAVFLTAIDPREPNIPSPKETADKKGFVSFGENNGYPNFLFDCYSECSILQSIINGMVDYTCGSGFADVIQQDKAINKTGETYNELVKKCVADYMIFGAFAVQIIRNKLGDVLELYWIDARKVRLDEGEKYVYFRKEWTRYSRDMKKYDRWQRDVKFDNCIYYYKRPMSRGLYGLPMWSSVVKDVQTSIEISSFHLNGICNNFAASAFVNFNNGVPTKEVQKEIERKINEKFSGSRNAARMMLSFNNNKDQAITLARVPEDNFDKKYDALSKSVKENIFVAFRAQPQLFGTDPDRTAFNSVEYIESFKLFKKTVVAPIQKEIETAFARIGEKYAFTLNEFQIELNPTTSNESPISI